MNQKNWLLLIFAYLFLFVLAVFPIFFYEFLPLQDYPNHLARMHIILNIQNDPFLQEYYSVKFNILPNLGMDIITPFLAKFFGLELAGRLTIALVVFALTGGSVFLNYALFKKPNLFPLTTFLLLLNQAFMKSFINFLLGIGLALWCLGLWILMKNSKAIIKIILFSLLCSILFICHLYAICFYGIALATYEARLILKEGLDNLKNLFNRLTIVGFQFIAPLILYFLSPTAASEDSAWFYTPLITKLKYLKMKLSDNYSSIGDWSTIAFLLLIPILGIYSKKLSFNKLMLFPVAAFIVVYLLIPNNLSTGQNSDWRLLIPLFFLVLSSINFNRDRNINIIISTIFIVIFIFRLSSINLNWSATQNEYKEIVNSIEYIDKGSRLFAARAFSSYYETLNYMYAPNYAIIKKSAFMPSLFAFDTQQPVQFNPNYLEIAKQTRKPVYSQGKGVDWQKVIDNYDYVLLAKEKLFKNIPKKDLENVFQGKYVSVYKVK